MKAKAVNSSARRQRTQILGTRLSGWFLIIGLLSLWEMSVRLRWIESPNWPSFSQVLSALFWGIYDGEMFGPLVTTLRRMLLGYVIGSSVGIVLGLLAGTSQWLRRILQPIVDILRPIPAPAIIPPLVLFLGVDDALKLFIIALASFYPTFLNALAGATGIDGILVETGRTFQAGWRRTIVSIYFPATLPSISAGLRIALTLSLVVTVIAEMIVGSDGLGYYLIQMQYAMRPEYMYAAIIWLAFIGYSNNRLFLLAEHRIIPWIGKT